MWMSLLLLLLIVTQVTKRRASAAQDMHGNEGHTRASHAKSREQHLERQSRQESRAKYERRKRRDVLKGRGKVARRMIRSMMGWRRESRPTCEPWTWMTRSQDGGASNETSGLASVEGPSGGQRTERQQPAPTEGGTWKSCLAIRARVACDLRRRLRGPTVSARIPTDLTSLPPT